MQDGQEEEELDSESAIIELAPGENEAKPTAAGLMTVEEGLAKPPALPYPLVAVGASAGGLKAFQEVLEHLPDRTGMTFVLVTHLAPDQRSYLTEIMERHTRMPVHAIEEGQRPEPDNVYILLPNQYVRMREGRFRLEERRHDDRTPATINTFFRSVANDQKNYALGLCCLVQTPMAPRASRRSKEKAASRWYRLRRVRPTGPCPEIRLPPITWIWYCRLQTLPSSWRDWRTSSPGRPLCPWNRAKRPRAMTRPFRESSGS